MHIIIACSFVIALLLPATIVALGETYGHVHFAASDASMLIPRGRKLLQSSSCPVTAFESLTSSGGNKAETLTLSIDEVCLAYNVRFGVNDTYIRDGVYKYAVAYYEGNIVVSDQASGCSQAPTAIQWINSNRLAVEQRFLDFTDKPYINLPFPKEQACSATASSSCPNGSWILLDSNLVSTQNLGGINCCDYFNCTGSTSAFPTKIASVSSASGGSNSGSSSKKVNAGAVAGGVIGGVAGLVLIATLVIYFRRRRTRNNYSTNLLPTDKAGANNNLPVVAVLPGGAGADFNQKVNLATPMHAPVVSGAAVSVQLYGPGNSKLAANTPAPAIGHVSNSSSSSSYAIAAGSVVSSSRSSITSASGPPGSKIPGSSSTAGSGQLPAGPLASRSPWMRNAAPAAVDPGSLTVTQTGSDGYHDGNTVGNMTRTSHTQAASVTGGSRPSRAESSSISVTQIKNQALESLRLDWSDIKIESQIGEGGFGKVMKGKWQGYRVAVKMLSVDKLGPAVLQELHQEALIMSELRHPSIARVFGLVDEGDVHALVMQYYRRGTLTRYLASADYMDLDQGARLKLAMQVASGMRFLHGKKPVPILHLDLKSSNLLVDDDGRLVIADFGLASTLVKTATNSAGEAQTSGALTLSISPPEVLHAPTAPRTASADVYAFGIVLLEIMAGQPAYRNIRAGELKSLVMSGRRPNIPSYVNAGLARLISDCWAQEPSARPSFVDVVDRLEAALKVLYGETELTTTMYATQTGY